MSSLSVRIARFLPPVTISLTFALVYTVSFIIASPLFYDSDAAWHIIAGDTIRRLGEIPDSNLWSFTTPNQKWYLISWLWDVLVSFIHSAGRPKAVFLSTQLLIALTMAVFAWHMSKRGGISSPVIVIIAVLARFCFNAFIISRPQLAGYLFVSIYHFRLHQSRDDRNFRRLLWLPLIMLLWINMHGSFLVVFVLLGAYMLEAAWRRQWYWLKQLSTIAALCLLVLPVNPYGFDLYDAVMSSLHSVMNLSIKEWMPFRFGEDFAVSLWMVLFILLSNFREPMIPLVDKLLCAIWLIPTLESNRHTSIFILISAPYMATNLQRFVDYTKYWRSNRIEMPALRIGMVSVGVAMMVASVGLTDILRSESYLISPGADSRPAIAWVRSHLAGKRIFNDYNFGGMIIYQSGGTFSVFVDGRASTAYPKNFLVDYLIFEQFYRGWAAVLDKYHIDAILVANYRPFATLYADGAKYEQWELVYRDKVASVFVRKEASPVLMK